MRFPIVLSLVAIGLVAFKIVTISTLVLGALVVASVVLPFVIVGAIIFGMVSLGMLVFRFIFGKTQAQAGVSPPRPAPGAARATVHAAASPPPWQHARYDWSRYANGRGFGRRRRHFGWVWVVLAIAVVCVMVNRSRDFKKMIQDHRVTRIVKVPIRHHGKKLPPSPPAHDDDDDSDDESQVVVVPAVPSPPPSPSAPMVVPIKPSPSDSLPHWTVTGDGDADYAKAKALERAEKEVVDYLQRRHIEWVPDQEYIDQHLVKERPNKPPTDLDGLKVEHRQLEVAITQDDYRDILQRDSQYRMDQRLLWAGAGLAGLVVLFGAIAGYIRLDEWSKGYYTWWLRLGALGFLGVAGAGLMLIFAD